MERYDYDIFEGIFFYNAGISLLKILYIYPCTYFDMSAIWRKHTVVIEEIPSRWHEICKTVNEDIL